MTVRDCPRPLPDPSATLACDCGWRHLLLGLTGKATFFIVNLLPLLALREWNTAGTWLFIAGASSTLGGSLGQRPVNVVDPNEP